MVASPAICQDDQNYGERSNQLVLDIYVDNTGKALIAGYADGIRGLTFLNSSEYKYADTSKQLSAITNTLTSKLRDNWSLNLNLEDSYNEYHAVFYLPIDAKLKGILCSAGLEYLVYTSDDSLIVDVQGYDVAYPAIKIEYRLLLTSTVRAEENSSYLYLISLVLFFSAIGVIAMIIRFRSKGSNRTEYPKLLNHSEDSVASNSKQEASAIKANCPITEDDLKATERAVSPENEEDPETTREIAAIMSTLTEREQSVLKALLERGGRMTQAEIKYETGISKSSLSGILTSMEKRKLITKKECGRTNAIEISERFSTIKERS